MMKICCWKLDSDTIVENKQIEWMKNLPSDLHDEPITKLAIPGRRFWSEK